MHLNNILKNLKDRTYLITQRNIFNDDVKNTISIDEVLNRLDTNKINQEWLNLLKDYDNQIQEKISNSIKNDDRNAKEKKFNRQKIEKDIFSQLKDDGYL